VEFGFSLIELLMVVALVGIVSVSRNASARPDRGSIELGEAARQVERELQSARMAAVAANQPVRVMFNCPVAGQYPPRRIDRNASVPAAADGVVGRCSSTTYPFPGAGQQPDYAPEQRRTAAHPEVDGDV
jgi:type II secretion system protein H